MHGASMQGDLRSGGRGSGAASVLPGACNRHRHRESRRGGRRRTLEPNGLLSQFERRAATNRSAALRDFTLRALARNDAGSVGGHLADDIEVDQQMCSDLYKPWRTPGVCLVSGHQNLTRAACAVFHLDLLDAPAISAQVTARLSRSSTDHYRGYGWSRSGL